MSSLTWRLGWRNLWRNTRRSIISISAIATALVLLVLMLGITEGLKEQMLENGTGLFGGHMQIHDAEYLPDRSLYDVVGGQDGVDIQALSESLQKQTRAQILAPRVAGFALLSTGEDSAGAQLMGIDPSLEPRVTTFLTGIVEGGPLSSAPAKEVLVGEALAKDLKVSVGTEIAAVTQAADGSMGNDLYRVKGILRVGIPQIDRFLVVFHYSDLQELMGLEPEMFHEIAVSIEVVNDADAVAEEVNASELLPPGALAQSWGELSPQLRDYLQMFEGMYGFLIGFIAIFAALGILNTMLMVVFERTREIGMLGAMGMAPSRIVQSILSEAMVLVGLGMAVGLILSACLMYPLSITGLDLSRWTGELAMMNTRMDPVIYVKWAWKQVWWSMLGLGIAALLASLFPAFRASRLDPVRAMQAKGNV